MVFSECMLLIVGIIVILITILGMGIIFVSLTRLGNMFDAISESQISKRKLYDIQIENEEKILYINKPKYTNELLAGILSLIDIEVDYFIMIHEKINEPVNIIDLDKKINKIANRVYEGIKTDSYSNELCLYTEDYVMRFIVNAVSKKIITESIMYNKSSYK